MQRVLEPELMDGEAQARAYAEADFDEPNSAFVEHVRLAAQGVSEFARVVDLGCGPADIAIRLARLFPRWRIDAVDGSESMLRLAGQAVDRAGLGGRITLVRERLPSQRLLVDAYDVVLSNSLLHHLSDPAVLWDTVVRVGRGSARVLVVDLARPATSEAAREIVDRYSPDEPEVLKRDFFNSLRAAFTLEEVREQLEALAVDSLSVRMVSDRHWLVSGCLPAVPQPLPRIGTRNAG